MSQILVYSIQGKVVINHVTNVKKIQRNLSWCSSKERLKSLYIFRNIQQIYYSNITKGLILDMLIKKKHDLPKYLINFGFQKINLSLRTICFLSNIVDLSNQFWLSKNKLISKNNLLLDKHFGFMSIVYINLR